MSCKQAFRMCAPTNGLDVYALQLRASTHGIMHSHVAGHAFRACRVVDSYQALPLLNSQWQLFGDCKSLVLYLACSAFIGRMGGRVSTEAVWHSTNLVREPGTPLVFECEVAVYMQGLIPVT